MTKVKQSGTYPVTENVSMRTELRTRSTVESGIVSDETIGGVRLVEYQPGNGRKYVVSVSDVSHHASKEAVLARPRRTALVWVQSYGRGWDCSVGGDSPVHYSLVQSRLSCSIFDAVVLAELLGFLLGRPAVSVEEFLRERAS
jgi:hypothetical protein